jgi:hypothetical protein
MLRRRQFCSALLSTAALAGSPAAWAQAEPPVHLLVGFPAGGGSDAIARLLARRPSGPHRAGGQPARRRRADRGAAAEGRARRRLSTLFLSHEC